MEINVWDIVQHVANIVVLFLLLRALLYNPVRRFMQKRSEADERKRMTLQTSLENAKSLELENKRILGEAAGRAKSLSDDKLRLADESANGIIADAKHEAERILAAAHEAIEIERKKARECLEHQTAEIAVALSQRIIKRELTLEDNERIVREFFESVGKPC